MKKIPKMNEAAWLLGVLFCTLGISLCTKAGLGLSMIAAPPYIIHLRTVRIFPWFSQGTAEYVFQGILIILTCIICRRFKVKYILSFVTALCSGFALDGWFFLFGGNGVVGSLPLRVLLFALGVSITSLAIAFYFRTDLPLQAYELLVSEIADKFALDKNKVKQANDACYLAGSVLLALILNRSLKGVGLGTVVITLVNAPLIAFFGKILDKFFVFDSLFKS